MNTKHTPLILGILVTVLLVSACGGAAAPEMPTSPAAPYEPAAPEKPAAEEPFYA
jgi:hypothetical protein